jgi:hypothetical protein
LYKIEMACRTIIIAGPDRGVHDLVEWIKPAAIRIPAEIGGTVTHQGNCLVGIETGAVLGM